MELPPSLIVKLLQDELIERQELEMQLDTRRQQIQALITENCEVAPKISISRGQWQNFCFQQLFDRTCEANTSFITYLNDLMPKLGFTLSHAHNNIAVYRGIAWKKKKS